MAILPREASEAAEARLRYPRHLHSRCSTLEIREENGGIAQLGEHLLCKQGVRSSILLTSTKKKIFKKIVIDKSE